MLAGEKGMFASLEMCHCLFAIAYDGVGWVGCLLAVHKGKQTNTHLLCKYSAVNTHYLLSLNC